MAIHLHVCMRVYAHLSASTYVIQKGASGPLGLEFRTVLSHSTRNLKKRSVLLTHGHLFSLSTVCLEACLEQSVNSTVRCAPLLCPVFQLEARNQVLVLACQIFYWLSRVSSLSRYFLINKAHKGIFKCMQKTINNNSQLLLIYYISGVTRLYLILTVNLWGSDFHVRLSLSPFLSFLLFFPYSFFL